MTLPEVINLGNGEAFPKFIHIMINYKLGDNGLHKGITKSTTFIHTHHTFFETHLWVPCLDTLKDKCIWTLNLIVSKSAKVSCSGAFHKQIDFDTDSSRIGYEYRVKSRLPPCKIGFFVGWNYRDHCNVKKYQRFVKDGVNFYFSSEEKLQDFKKFYIDEKFIIHDVLNLMTDFLNLKVPIPALNLVFVPTYKVSKFS